MRTIERQFGSGGGSGSGSGRFWRDEIEDLAFVVRRGPLEEMEWALSIAQYTARAKEQSPSPCAALNSPHSLRFLGAAGLHTPHFATHLRSRQRHLTPLTHRTTSPHSRNIFDSPLSTNPTSVPDYCARPLCSKHIAVALGG